MKKILRIINMKKLSFILLTLVVSLNSLALTQEEFFWRLEKDDIYKGGYFFHGGKVSPYSVADMGFCGYVLYKDGTGKYTCGSGSEYIEHNGMRAKYSWRENHGIHWIYKSESRGDLTVTLIAIVHTSYKISDVEIEMLTTHTDDQFQIIKNIVQQKINQLDQKYTQRLKVPLYYLVEEQRDGINRDYIVLTPAQPLPFNNGDYLCPVSKEYKEVIDSKVHKAGTTYSL